MDSLLQPPKCQQFYNGTTWPLDSTVEILINYEAVKEVRTIRQQLYPLLYHLTRVDFVNIAKSVMEIPAVVAHIKNELSKENKAKISSVNKAQGEFLSILSRINNSETSYHSLMQLSKWLNNVTVKKGPEGHKIFVDSKDLKENPNLENLSKKCVKAFDGEISKGRPCTRSSDKNIRVSTRKRTALFDSEVQLKENYRRNSKFRECKISDGRAETKSKEKVSQKRSSPLRNKGETHLPDSESNKNIRFKFCKHNQKSKKDVEKNKAERGKVGINKSKFMKNKRMKKLLNERLQSSKASEKGSPKKRGRPKKKPFIGKQKEKITQSPLKQNLPKTVNEEKQIRKYVKRKAETIRNEIDEEEIHKKRGMSRKNEESIVLHTKLKQSNLEQTLLKTVNDDMETDKNENRKIESSKKPVPLALYKVDDEMIDDFDMEDNPSWLTEPKVELENLEDVGWPYNVENTQQPIANTVSQHEKRHSWGIKSHLDVKRTETVNKNISENLYTKQWQTMANIPYQGSSQEICSISDSSDSVKNLVENTSTYMGKNQNKGSLVKCMDNAHVSSTCDDIVIEKILITQNQNEKCADSADTVDIKDSQIKKEPCKDNVASLTGMHSNDIIVIDDD